MKGKNNIYQYSYFVSAPIYDMDLMRQYNYPDIPFVDEMEYHSRADWSESLEDNRLIKLEDYGPQPFVVNINELVSKTILFVPLYGQENTCKLH